ncbi:4-Cys prefix domain-containing protein [[Phormidium] sp. ETS-05]|uniref:4-Cys prefix domain-containing protein n=1 Tax=[Phormidium] sp. ETS-05 TaxID=222819 RepID=UPI001E55C6D5|nr:4-Cys prefix domain-containing protein [[Phormidium] sp. ETS-05]
MSICINPQCPSPQNSDTVQYCQSCGSELLLFGRYRAVREMGKGGFGKTLEVRGEQG